MIAKFENFSENKIKCDKEFVVHELEFEPHDTKKGHFRLNADYVIKNKPELRERKTNNEMEAIAYYFEDFDAREPEAVARPEGDTTYFTTSGVQRIETISKHEFDLKKEKFVVMQPCVRSQFIDKVKDGTSTSFVNYSIESIRSEPREFVDLFRRFVQALSTEFNIEISDLHFKVKEDSVKWGKKHFNNLGITIYLGELELADAIYIKDYPGPDDEKISITDIGIGVERLLWATGKTGRYLSEFSDIYQQNKEKDTDEISAALDPLRSMVLIASEDIEASNHDQGYRFRQFSKRFVRRAIELNLPDLSTLVSTSLQHWTTYGHTPKLDEEGITKRIKTENDRNVNALFLKKLHDEEHKTLDVNLNQPTKDFLKQLRQSIPESLIEKIKNSIL